MSHGGFDHWFFDLDGTLIDSSDGILACIRSALSTLGREIPDEAHLRGWIGPPLRASFAPSLDHDATLIERAVQLYLQHMDEAGWRNYRIFDGVEEKLRSLHAEGARLCLVTAKVETFARRILADTPFGPLFSEIVGATADGSRSLKADLIAEALHRTGASPSSTVMVGDHPLDMRGARHHGMAAIGVLWGYSSAADLRDAGAHRLVDSPAQL